MNKNLNEWGSENCTCPDKWQNIGGGNPDSWANHKSAPDAWSALSTSPDSWTNLCSAPDSWTNTGTNPPSWDSIGAVHGFQHDNTELLYPSAVSPRSNSGSGQSAAGQISLPDMKPVSGRLKQAASTLKSEAGKAVNAAQDKIKSKSEAAQASSNPLPDESVNLTDNLPEPTPSNAVPQKEQFEEITSGTPETIPEKIPEKVPEKTDSELISVPYRWGRFSDASEDTEETQNPYEYSKEPKRGSKAIVAACIVFAAAALGTGAFFLGKKLLRNDHTVQSSTPEIQLESDLTETGTAAATESTGTALSAEESVTTAESATEPQLPDDPKSVALRAYAGTLRNFMNSKEYKDASRYDLFDITQDGIPELFLSVSDKSTETEDMVKVYTYADGRVRELTASVVNDEAPTGREEYAYMIGFNGVLYARSGSGILKSHDTSYGGEYANGYRDSYYEYQSDGYLHWLADLMYDTQGGYGIGMGTAGWGTDEAEFNSYKSQFEGNGNLTLIGRQYNFPKSPDDWAYVGDTYVGNAAQPSGTEASKTENSSAETQTQTNQSAASVTKAKIVGEYNDIGDGYMFRLDVSGNFDYWTAEVKEKDDLGDIYSHTEYSYDLGDGSYITGGSVIDELSATVTPYDENGTPGKPVSVKWNKKDIELILYDEYNPFIFTGYVATKKSDLVLRSYPFTESAALAKIPKDTELDIYESTCYGWYITYYKGKYGYVSADYIGVAGHSDW